MKKVVAILVSILFVLSVTGLCFAQAAPAPAKDKAVVEKKAPEKAEKKAVKAEKKKAKKAKKAKAKKAEKKEEKKEAAPAEKKK